MDHMNAKNKQCIDSLIQLTWVYSSDIGITVGFAKCGHLIVSRDKMKSTNGISVPVGQIDNICKCYKYLESLQSFGNNNEETRCKATSLYRNQVMKC